MSVTVRRAVREDAAVARRFAAVASLLLLVAACGRGDDNRTDSTAGASGATPTTAVRDCGGTTTIGTDGIGALRVGAAVDAVRASCDVVRDTTTLATEGMSARTLLVRIADDSVAAVVVNDKVQSISIESPRFQTADSLGVGAPVARLLAEPGVEVFGGEGNVAIALPTHCGMSFLLPREIAGKFPIPTIEGLKGLPTSARVGRVLLFACVPNAVIAAPGG